MITTMTHAPDTRRSSSPAVIWNNEKEKFPLFDDTARNLNLPALSESPSDVSPRSSLIPEYKWPSRKGSQRAKDGRQAMLRGHRPRRSLSDALSNLKNRRGSVSDNAQEIAEALKAPLSWRLIGLCVVWYMTSALTNTSSKTILNTYPQPVTLTIVQFASVSVWCLVLASLARIFPQIRSAIPALKNGLRYPTWDVLATALPLSVFQLLGHLLSSYATSKIPVSLVHTIKGLSPLFTVAAYRIVFRIRYARATYLSLIPLTLGVMLACSTDFSTNFWGIGASFVAALVFVTQNIFSKKLFNEAARVEAEGHTQQSRKLDKLNLLCYCSVGAFLFTAPVWLYSEGFGMLHDVWNKGGIVLSMRKGAFDHGRLTLEFLFNGLCHFVQNIMAFILLSMLSPVSYSVASLVKRVWVIVIAVIWFRSSTTGIQVVGIALTCFGLYLYDRTSMEDAGERRAKADHFHSKSTLLPVQESPDRPRTNGHITQARKPDEKYDFPGGHFKKDDGASRANDNPFQSGWLPPGTKQESTWVNTDPRTKQ